MMKALLQNFTQRQSCYPSKLWLSLKPTNRLKEHLPPAGMCLLAALTFLFACDNLRTRLFGEKSGANLSQAVVYFEKPTDVESRPGRENNLEKPHADKAPSAVKLSAVQVPSVWRPVNAWQHTREIGTVEHPTLDGGLINAADGLPIAPPPFQRANVKVSPSAGSQKEPVLTGKVTEHAAAFDDRWATSAEVKKILAKAAASGELGYVLRQTDHAHMPATAALVPLVESAYQDKAVSPKGAKGAWQLMAQTAQEQGIDPDQRQDFMPATQAALRYLTQLHETFGSWTLAYAAYNAGQSRVSKALQANPWALSLEDLNLPLETKTYVKRLKETAALIGEGA